MRSARWGIAGLLFVLSGIALTQQNAAAPEAAGRITALLTTGTVQRTLRNGRVNTLEAAKGERVIWNDVLITPDDGRMRVLLKDQSILSLGNKSRLVVVKHDAANQQTALDLTYGRVRAKVTEITRSTGSFEIHTPTAVAGVIGTDFFVEVDSNGETEVTCLKGNVRVRNADPKIKGEEIVHEGHTTRVKRGGKPAKPVHATRERLEGAQRATEVGENAGHRQGGAHKGKKGK